jgi:hypothetical protein
MLLLVKKFIGLNDDIVIILQFLALLQASIVTCFNWTLACDFSFIMISHCLIKLLLLMKIISCNTFILQTIISKDNGQCNTFMEVWHHDLHLHAKAFTLTYHDIYILVHVFNNYPILIIM